MDWKMENTLKFIDHPQYLSKVIGTNSIFHLSYSDLMKVVNSDVEPGETKVVNSRYSIVMATAKRARQIVNGDEALVDGDSEKPLSIAIEELNQGMIKIIGDEEE